MFSLVADAAFWEEGGEVLGSYRSYGKLEEVKGQMIKLGVKGIRSKGNKE